MRIGKRGKNRYVEFKFLAVFFLLITAGTLIFFISANSKDEPQPVAAPLSKEFLKYIEMQKQGWLWPMYTADGYPLGHIPHPVDVDYCEEAIEESIEPIGFLPASYDLRTKNKLTNVKDQGSCGSCWAFAIMAGLESSLLTQEVWDLSEMDLITKHGFKMGPCDGGGLYMAMAYLARWAGPFNESDVPYIYTADKQAQEIKHVQNVIFIPEKKKPLDNKKIKKAIMKYGVVYVCMYYDSSKYNPTYCAFYNKDIEEGAHCVCIVGWDDAFDKNNFLEIPPGNGAFLVRNSWGTDYGDGGYFYVSYYDEYFAKRGFSAAFERPESPNNYKEIYEYDPSGCTQTYGYYKTKAWFANIFSAKSNSSLAAVSFYALGLKNNYTVYIYTNVDKDKPRSGSLAITKKGKFQSPGYYTIPIGSVPLTKGKKFSVVVELTTKGWNYPIPLEYPISGYTKKVKGKKNQSFVSSDGNSWADIVKDYKIKKTNVCLKAFTK